MRRPVVAVTICYIAGIAVGRLWLVDHSRVLWLVGLVLIAAAAAIYRKILPLFTAGLFLAVAAAGAAAFIFASSPAPGGVLDYAGAPIYVEGTVVDEPLLYDDHIAYRLRVEAVETKEGRFSVPGTLQVQVYGTEQEPYWYGERLRLRGAIVEPRGMRNPGGFDYRFYLRSQGIDALIYPKPLQVKSLGSGETGLLPAAAQALRSRMVERIEANLPSPAAELLIAVLFGQRHRLPEDVQENFTMSGTGHLMAVSGLHVGLVAALILGLWRRLGLRGPLPLLLAIVLIFAYAYLTGLRPSALRAALMLSLALGALLLDRENDLPTAMAIAALVTLLFNPLLLFTVGFQLSYGATLSLIYLTPPLKDLLDRLKIPSFLGSLIAVTAAAQIGVLPLCAYHFQHIPVGALFFNLLLLPLMAPLAGLGLAGALFSLVLPAAGSFLLWGCRPLLELMLLITAAARLPGFYLPVFPPANFTLFLIYATLIAALALYYRARSAAEEGARGCPAEKRNRGKKNTTAEKLATARAETLVEEELEEERVEEQTAKEAPAGEEKFKQETAPPHAAVLLASRQAQTEQPGGSQCGRQPPAPEAAKKGQKQTAERETETRAAVTQAKSPAADKKTQSRAAAKQAEKQGRPPFKRPAAIFTAILVLAVLLWVFPLHPAPQELTITFLDVGQGAAALVESPCGTTVLIDAGGDPAYKGDPGRVGEKILLPFLRAKAIRRLDLVVITHPHDDHFGGMLPLVGALPIGQVLISPVPGESASYAELLETIQASGIPLHQAQAGQLWSSSGAGLSLEILWPPKELLSGSGSDLNNNSVVLRLRYRNAAALFCGDIEEAAVEKLLQSQTDLAAHVLLLPHHGGYLAAAPRFYAAVNPAVAVISLGANTFGHPHPFILASLEQAGIACYRTDRHGAVIVRTDGERLNIHGMEGQEGRSQTSFFCQSHTFSP